MDRIVSELGRIDVLINNAAGNFVSRAEDISPNGWNTVINIVLNGTAYCTLAAGRHMLKQGAGKVLSISAAYAWYGGPGTVHSAAAKAGVIAMSQTLAVEWGARGVRVNAVAPGWVKTEMDHADQAGGSYNDRDIVEHVPMGRFARPGDVASAIAWLCDGDQSGFVNGVVLPVDGGWTADGSWQSLRLRQR